MTAEAIDYATGEIVTGELVPFRDPGVERSPEGVVAVLTYARQWLASAVEMTGPAQVAAVKAAVAMASTYSRELQLSKEIQMDAQEMVRRAEYALGKAIRQGQERGEVATVGTNSGPRGDYERNGQTVRVDRVADNTAISPREFVQHSHELVEVYVMADADPELVEEAITEARTEGNPSRANVVRKIKGQQGAMTRDDRAKEIARLAGLGYSTRQIAPLVGIGEEAVHNIEKDYGISIPADKHVKNTRRIDTNRILFETVTALEGLSYGLALINPADIDREQAQTWLDSLTESIQALTKAKKQIKESLR